MVILHSFTVSEVIQSYNSYPSPPVMYPEFSLTKRQDYHKTKGIFYFQSRIYDKYHRSIFSVKIPIFNELFTNHYLIIMHLSIKFIKRGFSASVIQ